MSASTLGLSRAKARLCHHSSIVCPWCCICNNRRTRLQWSREGGSANLGQIHSPKCLRYDPCCKYNWSQCCCPSQNQNSQDRTCTSSARFPSCICLSSTTSMGHRPQHLCIFQHYTHCSDRSRVFGTSMEHSDCDVYNASIPSRVRFVHDNLQKGPHSANLWSMPKIRSACMSYMDLNYTCIGCSCTCNHTGTRSQLQTSRIHTTC